MDNFSTQTDQKMRWAGILEKPAVSRLQRRCLDGNNARNLKNILTPLSYDTLLDVGCGLGEYRILKRGKYVGLDNSFRHINYAQSHYSDCSFVHGDANVLPFKDKSFDATLFACATHHFDEKSLELVLKELARVSSKYVIIDDAIRYPQQGALSRFLYSLDRGTMFRTLEDLKEILLKDNKFRLIQKDSYKSFPGFYLHAVFVLQCL